MKTNKYTFSIIALALSVLHLIISIVMILRLPEIVPTHFDMNWVCDGMGSRWHLLIISALPLVAALTSIPFIAKAKPQLQKLTGITMLIVTGYLILMWWLIYPVSAKMVTLGEEIDPQALQWALPLLYSLIFVLVGNYLPIIPPNNGLGLRVGWTLNNPQCWRVTHRFAGRLWVITGLLMSVIVVIAALVQQGGKLWVYIIFFEMMVVNIAVPCIYAYIHKDDGTQAAGTK
jgi:uncharacterized membrane protein